MGYLVEPALQLGRHPHADHQGDIRATVRATVSVRGAGRQRRIPLGC
jgi:hypothetical protein